MSPQRLRVCAGLVMAVVVAPAVWFLPRAALLAAAALVAVLAAVEWGRLIGRGVSRRLYPLLCLAVIAWLWFAPPPAPERVLLYAAAGWWALVLVMVSAFSAGFCARLWFVWFLRVHIVVAAVAFWYAVGGLHLLHRGWLLYAIALTAACDIAAYYAGRRFGARKLCPDLSPGKTREGVLGALAAAFVMAAAVSAALGMEWLDAVYFVLLSLFICLAGVVGDLAASMPKRCAGADDSGGLLPGHGGVLDRADSLLAAAPLFLLGLSYL